MAKTVTVAGVKGIPSSREDFFIQIAAQGNICKGPLIDTGEDWTALGENIQWMEIWPKFLGLADHPEIVEQIGELVGHWKPTWDKYGEIKESGELEAGLEYARGLERRRVMLARILAPRVLIRPESIIAGDWDVLDRLVHPRIRIRSKDVGRPCGFNLTSVFMQAMIDLAVTGVTLLPYACPTCGNRGTWQPPLE